MKTPPLVLLCLLLLVSCRNNTANNTPPPANTSNINSSTAGSTGKPSTADQHVERSRDLYDQGDLAGCRAELNQAIASAPDHVEAIYLRGNLSMEEGQPDAAFTDAEKALSLKPDYAFALDLRGRVWAERQQFEKALADFKAAMAAEPTLADPYFFRAIMREAHLDQIDEAVEDFDKTISLNPGWAEAHNNRAYVLQELGKLDEALAGYEKAIALKPLPYFYNNRGSAKLLKGDIEGALADINNSISQDPKNAHAYCNLALVHLTQSKPADAQQSFDKCYSLNSSLKPKYEKLSQRVKRKTG